MKASVWSGTRVLFWNTPTESNDNRSWWAHQPYHMVHMWKSILIFSNSEFLMLTQAYFVWTQFNYHWTRLLNLRATFRVLIVGNRPKGVFQNCTDMPRHHDWWRCWVRCFRIVIGRKRTFDEQYRSGESGEDVHWSQSLNGFGFRQNWSCFIFVLMSPTWQWAWENFKFKTED